MDYFILSTLLMVGLVSPLVRLVPSLEILLHELEEIFYLVVYPSTTFGGDLFDLEGVLLHILTMYILRYFIMEIC